MTIGVLWYRREHYDELRRLFPDGRQLPETFDEWLSDASEGLARIEELGGVAVKVPIDLFRFPRWCASQDMACDFRARQLFVAEFVRRHCPPRARRFADDLPAAPPPKLAASARRRALRQAQLR